MKTAYRIPALKAIGYKKITHLWRELSFESCRDSVIAMARSKGYMPMWHGANGRRFQSVVSEKVKLSIVFGDNDLTLPEEIAQEQEEIGSTPINVEELRQLPDEGKAVAPATINKVDRARNLMEQRVEAGQSFTVEEASLAKQKLGVVVPSELIGKEVTAVDKTTATPAKGTRAEYDAAYAENLKKTGGNQRVAQKLTALQVGLAPGASPDTLPTTPPTVTPTRIEGGKEVEVRGGGVSQSLQVQPDVAKEIPAGANTVYGMSSANAEASTAMTKASNVNTNVTAPTTVNNNTVSSNKPDVRNQDSSFKRMLDARYVPV